MSIVLPTWPGPATASPVYYDFGTTMDGGPHGGGPRIHRLGNRFGLEVVMPKTRAQPRPGWGVGASVFLSRLRQAMEEGAIYPWPQQGLVIGAPGAPVVAIDTAANVTRLVLSNLVPGYVWRESQFFNVTRADGRQMLHHTTGEVVTAQDGTATLSILPRLRASLKAGSAINMEPVIEGRLSGDQQTWTLTPARTVPVSFTIAEYGSNR